MVLNHHPHTPNTPRHPCQPRCLSRSRWPSFCVSTACMAETPPLLAAFLPFLSPDTLPFASRAFPGRAVGLSRLTLIIGRFSRDYRELRFKNTIIPLPWLCPTAATAVHMCTVVMHDKPPDSHTAIAACSEHVKSGARCECFGSTFRPGAPAYLPHRIAPDCRGDGRCRSSLGHTTWRRSGGSSSRLSRISSTPTSQPERLDRGPDTDRNGSGGRRSRMRARMGSRESSTRSEGSSTGGRAAGLRSADGHRPSLVIWPSTGFSTRSTHQPLAVGETVIY